MVQAYCFKDKKKVDIKDAKRVVKKGRTYVQGKCPICGGNVCVMARTKTAYPGQSEPCPPCQGRGKKSANMIPRRAISASPSRKASASPAGYKKKRKRIGGIDADTNTNRKFARMDLW